MKKVVIFLIIVIFFLSGCKSKETYVTAKCSDGFEYNKEICKNNKCEDIKYFADPCLGHYEKECNSDLDCGVGGCSGQICGRKDEVKYIITTCSFTKEDECLYLTKCSCIQGKCKFQENEKYQGCLRNIPLANVAY